MAPPQWAYQVEHFATEPDEELVCSICRAVFCNPVMCPCDHVFCRECVCKWLLTSRNCPICRKRVSQSSVKKTVPIIKNIIMKLVINCHNKSLGCTGQFSVESSEAHVKECEYEFVQCKNKPCKDKLFRKDIAEHEMNDCPHRYIKCQRCRSKMPTSASTEKHDCIQALRIRLRRKSIILRKKNAIIEELEKENKALKTGSQGAEQPVSSTSGDYARPRSVRNISPEEFMINIAEYDSTSSSLASDSDDDLSGGSIIFVSDSPGGQSDNVDSDSFLSFIDSEFRTENSQDESMVTQEAAGYSHVGSQTTFDSDSNGHVFGTNSNSALESGGNSAEASSSALNETGERPQTRQIKRRPTAQKPAKRRLPPLISSSDDEPMEQSAVQSPKRCWLYPPDSQRGSEESNQIDNRNSTMEAGPSSESVPVGSSSAARHFKFPVKPRPKQGNSRRVHFETVPSNNAVFERTLQLMDQYDLDSDPDWLPEYASHRGDTPSPTYSDTSSSESSSSSDKFNSDNEENSEENLDASSDLVK